MIKTKIKMMVLGFALLVLGLGGCKKTCYECSLYGAWVVCIKNSDTAINDLYSGPKLRDTVAKYTAMGYTCDTADYLINKGEACDIYSKNVFEQKNWTCK